MTSLPRRFIGPIRVAVVIAMIGAVEILCRTGVIDPFTMIAPSAMVVALVRILETGHIGPDAAFTLTNTLAAIAVSVVLGFVLGAIVHGLPRLRRVITPLLAAYYAVPTFVFYPVLIVLFGLNRLPLIAIGAALGVVGMMVSTLDGLDRVPRVLLKTATAYRMTPFSVALRIKLPAAAPQLFTGVKLAVTYSIIGTLAGEFILSVAGLGRRLAIAYNDLDNPTMYGLLLLVLTTVVVLNAIVFHCERRVYRRWQRT
ncbi:MAG TPA: ABC transporter permease subunit [Alphaproteobacteria bacterium]|nr:ABC transporter permease subunit [Alphaproteobacteria bacterium]